MRLLVQTVVLAIPTLVLVGACSTSRPTTRNSPPATVASDSLHPSKSPNNNSWSPHIKEGQWRYVIQDSSTISINNDTTAHVEPVESTMIYTMVLTDSVHSLTFSGHIDSLLINSHLAKKSRSDTSEASEVHGFVSRQGQFTQIAKMVTACTNGSAASVSRISELLIMLPSHSLNPGDRWSDTSSTTTCHGKIPLKQIALRNYELLDLSSCPHGGVKVRRSVSDSLTGSSVEGNNHPQR